MTIFNGYFKRILKDAVIYCFQQIEVTLFILNNLNVICELARVVELHDKRTFMKLNTK